MSFIEFMKRNLMIYFIVVTGITVAIAILGLNYDSGTTFGYEAYFSPIIFGAVAVLPSFALYSKKELTFRQMFVRRMLHFIVLELTLLGFGFWAGLFSSIDVAAPFALSVFVIYLFTYVIQWIIDSKTAGEINKGLKRLQE
jgi:hypothetical protein